MTMDGDDDDGEKKGVVKSEDRLLTLFAPLLVVA
jgi:hypothetical protein